MGCGLQTHGEQQNLLGVESQEESGRAPTACAVTRIKVVQKKHTRTCTAHLMLSPHENSRLTEMSGISKKYCKQVTNLRSHKRSGS